MDTQKKDTNTAETASESVAKNGSPSRPLSKPLGTPLNVPKKKHPLFDNIGTASMLGLHIVSGTIVGAVMGYFLDVWLGTKPWLFLIFLFLGIGAGFRNMWHDAKRIIKNISDTD